MMNKQEFEAIPLKERLNRVLEGVAYYANIQTPNTAAAAKFNADPYYVVNLVLDKAEEIAKAESFGLTIHEANQYIPGPHVKIKRKIKPGVDPESVKPQIVDSLQKPVPSVILVGNGSKVLVKFGTYWYATGKGGIGTTLFKVQIKELVPYTRTNDPNLDMNAEGFSVESLAGAASADSEDIIPDEIPFTTDEVEPSKKSKKTTKFDE